MKYSTKVSDAVHVLVFVALNVDGDLSSDRIAESVRTNPAFVRQLMSSLRRAGIIASVRGHARPSLARPADEITLLDVYKAVEGDKPLLHLDTHTNPECGVGVNIQLALQTYYDRVQRDAEASMAGITLEDIISSYHERVEAVGGLRGLFIGAEDSTAHEAPDDREGQRGLRGGRGHPRVRLHRQHLGI